MLIRREHAPSRSPRKHSKGGGFWWNYCTEMVPKNELWSSLHDLYRGVHGGLSEREKGGESPDVGGKGP